MNRMGRMIGVGREFQDWQQNYSLDQLIQYDISSGKIINIIRRIKRCAMYALPHSLQHSIRKRSITTNKIQTSEYKSKYTTAFENPEASTTPKFYRYYLGPGNNSHLIRRILSTRKNWTEITDSHYMFINFKWQQSNKGFSYDSCVDNKVFIHSLNHMEFHQELSNKEKLLHNITDFCEANRMNAFDFVPVTFVLSLSDSNFESVQNQFMKFYEANLPETSEASQKKQTKKWLNIPRRRISSNTLDRRIGYHYSKPAIKETFMMQNSSYLWILKPTFYNRGRGIHIFSTITQLQELMKSYIQDSGINMLGSTMTKSAVISSESKNEESDKKKTLHKFRIRQVISHNNNKVITNSFIIQKYLQSPLLIESRKFDIRVWVLITHELKVYFYREGYVRTSSSIYETSPQKINDLSIHLTNNAVQKDLKNYGKFQEGNQLSFKFLQSYVTKLGGDFQKIRESMKKIAKIATMSVRKKMNKNNRKFCFQLFGFDFMIDAHFKVWLIQVNTNPCLEQSSLILENLLPRMIDDTFKLTIDEIFQGSTEGNRTNYVLQNYHNNENLWDFIVDLKKPSYNF